MKSQIFWVLWVLWVSSVVRLNPHRAAVLIVLLKPSMHEQAMRKFEFNLAQLSDWVRLFARTRAVWCRVPLSKAAPLALSAQ